MLGMLLGGSHLRRTHALISFVWLIIVLGKGDLVVLIAFGNHPEVFVLTGLAGTFGLIRIWRMRDWNAFGQIAWMMTLIITPLFHAYAYSIIITAQLPLASFIAALMFLLLQIVASQVALTHMFENIDVTCRVYWHRRIEQVNPGSDFLPMVSLHLHAYDEPPDVVGATLRAIAALDYPNYEVLVIDNNTPEEKTWRPVEKLCRELGPHFRFIHLDNWPGFKAGALNFAMTQTSALAEIIGVIDADYQVYPSFLRELVPAFTDS
jgi:hypothetical protein